MADNNREIDILGIYHEGLIDIMYIVGTWVVTYHTHLRNFYLSQPMPYKVNVTLLGVSITSTADTHYDQLLTILVLYKCIGYGGHYVSNPLFVVALVISLILQLGACVFLSITFYLSVSHTGE